MVVEQSHGNLFYNILILYIIDLSVFIWRYTYILKRIIAIDAIISDQQFTDVSFLHPWSGHITEFGNNWKEAKHKDDFYDMKSLTKIAS